MYITTNTNHKTYYNDKTPKIAETFRKLKYKTIRKHPNLNNYSHKINEYNKIGVAANSMLDKQLDHSSHITTNL